MPSVIQIGYLFLFNFFFLCYTALSPVGSDFFWMGMCVPLYSVAFPAQAFFPLFQISTEHSAKHIYAPASCLAAAPYYTFEVNGPRSM